MHQTGIMVDEEYRDYLDQELTKTATKRKEILQTLAPEVQFTEKEASKADLRRLIYGECDRKDGMRNFGIYCPPIGTPQGRLFRSGTGKPSVGRDALNQIFQTAPDELRRILVAYREFGEPLRLRGSFVRGKHIQEMIWPDGAAHPNWNSGSSRFSKDESTGGAVTGRLTGDLMNVPKKDPKRGWPNIRGMFVPRPGHVFVEIDYTAAEGWAIAAITGDPVWRTLLQSGDIHTASAIRWFKLPPTTTKDNCPSRVRTLAKNGRYACCYEAQDQKIHTQLVQGDPDATLAEAGFIRRSMNEMHPIHVAWRRDEHQRVLKCHYSASTIMGRRRYYVEQPKPTETSNYPIQSTIADIINCSCTGITPSSMVRSGLMDRLGRNIGGKILAQVHDSLLLETRAEYAEETAKRVRETMEGPWIINGKEWIFPAESKIFPERWGT